jgi:hypothetical protein
MTQKKTPSADNKALARHAVAAFGGKPKVIEYRHDHLPLRVDVLQCAESPDPELVSYATIGLSDTPLMFNGSVYPTRVELVGACGSEYDLFPNILSSAAFHMMRNAQLYPPGSLLRDYVPVYYPDTTVPHLYFTAPFTWEEKLQTLTLEQKQVAWLMAVPVSDGEAEYLEEHGDEELERLLEEKNAEYYNLHRPSCV